MRTFFFANNAMKKVAIQGYPGAFHEIAARFYYDEDIEIVPADTFDQVVSLVENNAGADVGLMAIENSIAGSLLYNYDLINKSSLTISGELFLRIKHNLLVLPGKKIQDITEVHSHHMAIAQCKEFFRFHPHIKLVESKDTAESARRIQDEQLQHVAALASDLAGEMYHLEAIEQSIETNKLNYTRFIVLDHFMNAPSDHIFDKVSLSFAVSHEIGSLYRALKVLNDLGANLTKIQSAPITGRPFEYLFFVDFMLEKQEQFGAILQGLSETTKGLKILGRYKAGIHHEN
ncbi:MAG: prephenate dehydratase [Saprospiraceae bacterium]|nr:prephenate dehydratase [Saprospiraceae bacterium]